MAVRRLLRRVKHCERAECFKCVRLRLLPERGAGEKTDVQLLFIQGIMVRRSTDKRKGRTSIWLLFGVGILILLLLVWLTIADFWGDTDVAAMILP